MYYYIVETVGILATTLSIIRAFPQIIKLIVHKSSRDISKSSVIMGVIYNVCFLFCGIVVGEFNLIVTDASLLVISIVLLVTYFIFEAKKITSDRLDVEEECVELMAQYNSYERTLQKISKSRKK